MNIIIGILAYIALIAFIIWRGSIPTPKYRVVQNGAGKFLVQEYQYITPPYGSDDPRIDNKIENKYVTICSFDTLQEASAQYRKYMALYRKQQAEEKSKQEAERAIKRRKEIDDTIVKVYKISET